MMKHRNHKGFTLIELLTTSTITIILLTLAAPSFGRLINKSRAQERVEGTLSVLQLARTTAINEHQLVTVCAGTPSTGCTRRWQDGLLAYRGAPTTLPAPENVLYSEAAISSTQLKGNISRLVFNETGTLEGQSGSLLVCPENGDEAYSYRLVVNRGGRPRVYTLEETSAMPSSRLTHRDCNYGWRY